MGYFFLEEAGLIVDTEEWLSKQTDNENGSACREAERNHK